MERTSIKGIRNGLAKRALLAYVLLASFAGLLVVGASAASAAGKLELIALHGPSAIPIQPSINQQWTLTVGEEEEGVPTNAGHFKLEIEMSSGKEFTTKPVPFDATGKELQESLEAAKSIGPGNVIVTGGPQAPGEAGWSYTIEFVGALAGTNLVEVISPEEVAATHAEEKALEAKGEEVAEGAYEAEVTRQGFRDTAMLELVPVNTGATPVAGPVTITDTLPSGLSTAEAPEGEGWTCKPETEGATSVKCTFEGVVNPDAEGPRIAIPAVVDTAVVTEGEQLVNHVSMTWEKTQSVSAEDTMAVSQTPEPFGINRFQASTFGADGKLYTVAGGHPYAATTSFFFNTIDHYNPGTEEVEIISPGNLKDADVVLPEGFIGNPAGRARCTQADFTIGDIGQPGSSHIENGELTSGGCPPDSQVGVANVYIKSLGFRPNRVPVYNLVAPAGSPAEFGFVFENIVPVRLDAHVTRLNGKYRVTVLSVDTNEGFNVNGVALTLWGTPAEASHDVERNKVNHLRLGEPSHESPVKPFLTNPADCLQQAEQLPVTQLYYDQWQHPGALNANGDPVLNGGNWLLKEATSPAVKGCEALTFAPALSFKPSPPLAEVSSPLESGTTQAAAPSGYEFNLEVPQSEEPGTLGTPQLKDTTVTLPPGVSLSPSAANGLVACTDPEIDVESTQRGNCPEASQVGTVRIKSNLLEEELKGRVYVGEPKCNPCHGPEAEQGQLVRLFIEAEAAQAGVRVKLPGNATVDQATGQVTSTFLDNPQVPFTTLKLTLKGGPRASLANPPLCGAYATNVLLTPWSIGGKTREGLEVFGTPAAERTSGFEVDWDGEAGKKEACPESLAFSPSFVAGTESTQAGAYTDFDTVFSRTDDREQAFSSKRGIVVKTPAGLLGKIAGVAKCEEPALKALEDEAGTCPANSRIATATSAAGPGPDPFQASGPVFLTGPYTSPVTGASGPFGLAIAVPAKAGPFNLGTVVVHAAISIDPRTSAITITSDPIPLSRDGIPLRVQQVEVKVDRPEFMFNPTNCEAKALETSFSGEPAGAEAPIGVTRSAHFQASNCGVLPFAPTLTASTGADFSKKNGTSFTVKVEEHHGEANIAKVELQLPIALPSRIETLQKACPVQTFEANPANCNPLSVVGSATAHTPLLNAPLTGPAYLVSHAAAAFPDLVFLLQGEGVHIELVGHTDIKKGITYSRFESVPDAPISSFETVLPKGPDSILGAFGNLCEQDLKAPTTIISQSNKRFEQNTQIAVSGCGPTVSISRVKLSGKALLVTVKTTGGGTIKVSGAGLKTTTSAGLKRGSKQIRVALSKSGIAAKAHKRKVAVKVSVSAAGKSATKTATVKL